MAFPSNGLRLQLSPLMNKLLPLKVKYNFRVGFTVFLYIWQQTKKHTYCRFWIFFSAQFVNWWWPFHSILFVTFNSFSHSIGRNKEKFSICYLWPIYDCFKVSFSFFCTVYDVTLVSMYLWMETNLFTEMRSDLIVLKKPKLRSISVYSLHKHFNVLGSSSSSIVCEI